MNAFVIVNELKERLLQSRMVEVVDNAGTTIGWFLAYRMSDSEQTKLTVDCEWRQKLAVLDEVEFADTSGTAFGYFVSMKPPLINPDDVPPLSEVERQRLRSLGIRTTEDILEGLRNLESNS